MAQDNTACTGRLTQIALALQNYERVYKSLPPTVTLDARGRPMHSWRTLLLPYLGLEDVYSQYHLNEPWNSPNNKKVGRSPLVRSAFQCPAAAGASPKASYLAITRSSGEWAMLVDRESPLRGMLIVEVPSSEVEVLEPRDVNVQDAESVLRTVMNSHKGRAGIMGIDLNAEVRFVEPILGGSTCNRGKEGGSEPQIAWSLINASGIDPYSGLDQFNRIVDNRWYSTATSDDLDRIQHGYDRASNRLWRKNTVAEAADVYLDELYAYDGIYRLSLMQRGELDPTKSFIVSGTLNFAQAWSLDATDNWPQFWQNVTGASWDLQQFRAASLANEITSIIGGGWAQPAYDAAGNMAEMPQPSSPSTSNQMIFDAWNRMVSVSSNGSSIQQNVYDGENRRVTKLVGATWRHFYFSLDWQSLEERLGSLASPDRQFVWGLRYIDDLILRDCSDVAPPRLYASQDPNWNMTAVCDSSGAVSERYAYAAYGTAFFMDAAFSWLLSSDYDWETLFSGYRFDSETGLSISRARLLIGLLGRWLTVDPLSYARFISLLGDAISDPSVNSGGSQIPLLPDPGPNSADPGLAIALPWWPNVYSYVKSDPLNRTDPSGLWELRCRGLSNAAGVTLQRHCWVECDGKSYSLLNVDGTATPSPNDPADIGRGKVVDSGDDKCGCIAAQFDANQATYPYDKDDCNSNYYASQILKCCGIRPHPKTPWNIGRPGGRPPWHRPGRPAAAYGWDRCNRDEGKFKCKC